MKFLNREMQIALDALQVLSMSNPNFYRSSKEIAEILSEPKGFVHSALNKLSQGGFVTSKGGKGGGYKLAERAENKTLAKFIQVFDREYVPNPSLPALQASERVQRSIRAYLRGTYLSEIFKGVESV